MRITRRLVLLPALISLLAAGCLGQTPAKEPTASISGNVTISGKPAVGIIVVATMSTSFFDNKTVAKTTTDENGNYKLVRLRAGRFSVMPMAKAYVMVTGTTYKPAGQAVNLTESEAVTKIDFALVRGGVISGRITDAEGHSLIGERVTIASKDNLPDPNVQMSMLGGSKNQTDDRGMYRVYGLGPGSYKVSVGQSSTSGAVTMMGLGASQYLKTFYPGVQDETKATVIEIKEGAEIANVDITANKPGTGFSASGRVVEADSGQPVPNLFIGHSLVNDANQEKEGMNFTGIQTDSNGRFQLEGLRPGRYTVYTFNMEKDNSTYSEATPFEISDSDVTGIEVKLRRGGTLSGVAILENTADPTAASLLQSVNLAASVQGQGLTTPSYSRSQIGTDGSFRFAGLSPGRVRIFVQGFPTPPKGLTLVRTEVDGLEQTEGVEVAAGGNTTGVRLIFAYGTGSIRGQVKIEGGELPEGTTISLSLSSAPGNNRRFTQHVELDARYHFAVENLPPGNYELLVRAVLVGGKDAPGFETVKQAVSVTNGADEQLTLVLDVNKKKGDQ